MVKPKGLMEYLADDPSLTKKITLEEFENHTLAADNVNEATIEEAYEEYKKVMEKLSD